MKRFRYLKIHRNELMIDDVIDVEKLDKLGIRGWELCLISYYQGKTAFFYFKRELSKKVKIKEL